MALAAMDYGVCLNVNGHMAVLSFKLMV